MGLNGYKKKPRGKEQRKRNSFVFISAEGNNKTETLYFQQFQNKNVRFKFVTGTTTDPVKMSKDLIKKMHSEDFDADYGDCAFCLIDGDNLSYKNQQIAEADALASKNGFEIILSNPCFEVWFICHDHYSTKYYRSSEEAVEEVKRLFPGYTKSNPHIYEMFIDGFNEAMKNAKRQYKWNIDQDRRIHTVEFQPSTEVFRIFEKVDLVK